MKIASNLAGALSRKKTRQGCAVVAPLLADEKLVLAARSFLRRVGS